ncbi:MAG: DNA repair protein RecO, partial [Clostridia bacterium]
MKLIKLKGIVIKDVNYSDNDKILTILTDECGVITCMSKGCRKSTSSFLTSSQYLVYSEFILYKGTSFYHLNSCSSITTFYNLRTDYDKLNLIFDITKNMKNLIYEETDSKEILSLFLNLLYIIEKDIKDNIFAISVFKIK